MEKIIAFTDGASLGNPGPGGYGVVMINSQLSEVVELGGNKKETTNNEMELTAIVSAVSYSLMSDLPILIYTDSAYVVNGITKWIHGWKRRGFMTKENEPVKNRRLWEDLDGVVSQKVGVEFKLLPSHMGIPGNERADEIATLYAKGEDVVLFRGNMGNYGIEDILKVPSDEEVAAMKEKKAKRKNGKAYSYLSVVDGVLMVHKTWKECEERVRGVSAKYKKAMSREEEGEIIDGWRSEGLIN